jgi:TPR repeat protein
MQQVCNDLSHCHLVEGSGMGAHCCKSTDYAPHSSFTPGNPQEVNLRSAKFLASVHPSHGEPHAAPGEVGTQPIEGRREEQPSFKPLADRAEGQPLTVDAQLGELPDPTDDPAMYAERLYEAGMAYDRGLKGCSKEPARAFELLKSAADLGHYEAQYRVGLYYDRGIVVCEDSKEAAFWYMKAADGGAVSAQFSLGICYSKGIGVPQDDAKALEWLVKAGQSDCDLALSSLGYFYEVGVCCERDLDRAVEYYQKAADLGNVFACQRLSMFGRRVIVA